jgi:hypothetical protein
MSQRHATKRKRTHEDEGRVSASEFNNDVGAGMKGADSPAPVMEPASEPDTDADAGAPGTTTTEPETVLVATWSFVAREVVVVDVVVVVVDEVPGPGPAAAGAAGGKTYPVIPSCAELVWASRSAVSIV